MASWNYGGWDQIRPLRPGATALDDLTRPEPPVSALDYIKRRVSEDREKGSSAAPPGTALDYIQRRVAEDRGVAPEPSFWERLGSWATPPIGASAGAVVTPEGASKVLHGGAAMLEQIPKGLGMGITAAREAASDVGVGGVETGKPSDIRINPEGSVLTDIFGDTAEVRGRTATPMDAVLEGLRGGVNAAAASAGGPPMDVREIGGLPGETEAARARWAGVNPKAAMAEQGAEAANRVLGALLAPGAAVKTASPLVRAGAVTMEPVLAGLGAAGAAERAGAEAEQLLPAALSAEERAAMESLAQTGKWAGLGGRAAATVFAPGMIQQSVQAGIEGFSDAMQNGLTPQNWPLILSSVESGVFGALAARHALAGAPRPAGVTAETLARVRDLARRGSEGATGPLSPEDKAAVAKVLQGLRRLQEAPPERPAPEPAPQARMAPEELDARQRELDQRAAERFPPAPPPEAAPPAVLEPGQQPPAELVRPEAPTREPLVLPELGAEERAARAEGLAEIDRRMAERFPDLAGQPVAGEPQGRILVEPAPIGEGARSREQIDQLARQVAQEQPSHADAMTALTEQGLSVSQAQKALRRVETPPERRQGEEPVPLDRRFVGERRQDVTQRQKVAEMSPEEMKRALLTDDMTGLGNRRAMQEDETPGGIAAFDVAGLKWFNDAHGHAAGDALLRAVGEAIAEEAGVRGFRSGGDEFFLHANSPEEAAAAASRIQERLAGAQIEVEKPDGSRAYWKGGRIDYGVAENQAKADAALFAARERASQRGERAARGERPLGLVEVDAEGKPLPGGPAPEGTGRPAEGKLVGPRPKIPYKKLAPAVKKLVRNLPERERDAQGNYVLPGQEDWPEDTRALVHAMATKMVNDVWTSEDAGRFPRLDEQGKMTGEWYGISSKKGGTPLADLPYTPKEMRDALDANRGNDIELDVHKAVLNSDQVISMLERLADYEGPIEYAEMPAYEKTKAGKQGIIPGALELGMKRKIRTEGREAEGPLFTQERDKRERAEAASQMSLFGNVGLTDRQKSFLAEEMAREGGGRDWERALAEAREIPNSGGAVIVDPSGAPPEVSEALSSMGEFSKALAIPVDRVVEALQAEGGYAGMTTDQAVRGAHLRRGQGMIFMNPLADYSIARAQAGGAGNDAIRHHFGRRAFTVAVHEALHGQGRERLATEAEVVERTRGAIRQLVESGQADEARSAFAAALTDDAIARLDPIAPERGVEYAARRAPARAVRDVRGPAGPGPGAAGPAVGRGVPEGGRGGGVRPGEAPGRSEGEAGGGGRPVKIGETKERKGEKGAWTPLPAKAQKPKLSAADQKAVASAMEKIRAARQKAATVQIPRTAREAAKVNQAQQERAKKMPAPVRKAFQRPAGVPQTAPRGISLGDETRGEWLRRLWVDKFARWDRLQKEMKTGGSTIDESSDVVGWQTLFPGKLETSLVRYRDDHVQPIIRHMIDAEITPEEAGQFLYANHHFDRAARIAKINPKLASQDPGTGFSDAEATAVLTRTLKGPRAKAYRELARLQKEMAAFQRKVLVESGLESQETVDSWHSAYGDSYVPLKNQEVSEGPIGTGRGFDIRGREAKSATGRKSRAANPLAMMIAQVESTLVRAEKNKVGQALLDMARKHPDPKFWTIDTIPETPKLDAKTGEVKWTKDPLYRLGDNVVAVKEDGKVHLIHFLQDDLLPRAMKNLGGVDGRLVTHAGAFTRLFSSMVTTYVPEFVVSNFARDIQTAMIHLQGEHGVKAAAKVGSYVPQAIRGMYRSVRGKEPGKGWAGEWQKWADEFRKQGGQTGFASMEDYNRQLRKLHRDVSMGSKRATPARLFRSGLRFVEDANSAVENGTRLAAYRAFREGGASAHEAAKLAKDLTVNFSRKGELSSTANALYAFFNAGVQGTDRVLRFLKSPQGRHFMVAAVAAGFVIDQANRALSDDSDGDGINDYDAIPDHVKERNFVVMAPDGKAVMVPMPWGYNFLYALGRHASAFVSKREKMPAAVWNTIQTGLGAFNPLGTGPIEQVVSPTALDPFVQISTNKQFTGAPIYPENLPFGAKKPPSELHFSSVSKASRDIARAMNALTGGDEFTPGFLSVSPEVIDHMASFLGGGAGRTLGQLMDLPGKLASGKVSSRKVPFLRRVLYEEHPGALNIRYRENLDEAKLVHDRYQNYKKKNAETRGGWQDKLDSLPKPMLKAYRQVHRLDLRLKKFRESGMEREDPRYQDLQKKAIWIIEQARRASEGR